MPITKISREDVFTAAHELSVSRKKPTMHAIRKKLGAGSLSTIHKYLVEWRGFECSLDDKSITNKLSDHISLENLEKDKIELGRNIKKLSEINESLLSKAKETSSLNESLECELRKYKDKYIDLEKLYEKSILKIENLNRTYNLSREEHQLYVDKILSDHERRESSLMAELKETNLNSRHHIQEVSSKLNDQVMAERIKSSNLEIKLSKCSDDNKKPALLNEYELDKLREKNVKLSTELQKIKQKRKMMRKHISAKNTHYDYVADKYDSIYKKNPEIDNKLIASILKSHKVNTVVDMACGTGAQVIYLAKKKFDISGYDINKKMLSKAKKKAKEYKLPCKLDVGDMRTTRHGKVDAVITIFNAIGHLTKADFKKTIRNVKANLNVGGIYVFDIFNLDYMLDRNNVSALTVDVSSKNTESTIRKIQYSDINSRGVLTSHTKTIVTSHKTGKSKETADVQTLQIYTIVELKAMLEGLGFKLVNRCSIDGGKFYKKKTKHMIIVAERTK